MSAKGWLWICFPKWWWSWVTVTSPNDHPAHVPKYIIDCERIKAVQFLMVHIPKWCRLHYLKKKKKKSHTGHSEVSIVPPVTWTQALAVDNIDIDLKMCRWFCLWLKFPLCTLLLVAHWAPLAVFFISSGNCAVWWWYPTALTVTLSGVRLDLMSIFHILTALEMLLAQ